MESAHDIVIVTTIFSHQQVVRMSLVVFLSLVSDAVVNIIELVELMVIPCARVAAILEITINGPKDLLGMFYEMEHIISQMWS
jgi:hypothetical protein